MLSSPRCRARTCSGKPCRSPAVRGKRPPDAWRCPRFRRSSRQYYGQYTREALAELKLLRNVFRQSRELLQDVASDAPRPRTPTAATVHDPLTIAKRCLVKPSLAADLVSSLAAGDDSCFVLH